MSEGDVNKPAAGTMKCLTVCQPWAWAIVGDVLCPAALSPCDKFIENRTWCTHWRGELLLHAGKSENYLGSYDADEHSPMQEPPADCMTYGAIVGVASLVAVLKKGEFTADHLRACGLSEAQIARTKRFAEGPWCFILVKKRRFVEPVPYKGAQGFFDVPVSVVDEQLRKAVEVG